MLPNPSARPEAVAASQRLSPLSPAAGTPITYPTSRGGDLRSVRGPSVPHRTVGRMDPRLGLTGTGTAELPGRVGC